jgi:long-chain fatty acid transport protein
MVLKKMGLLILITVGILSVICPGLAYAGAAYIYETGNPTDSGYAGAGLAGRASDAGTVFTNPAGMTRFEESTFLAGLTPLYVYAPFDPDENTTVDGRDGNTNEIFAGASFAYIHPVSDDLKLGISMQNFFGLSLDWGKKWVGRYQSTEATLIAPQLQPTVAYRVTNWLSFGAGAGLTLGYLKDKARVFTPNPNTPDGQLEYSDTDFAVQGNFGIMIEPSENTRFGVRYLTETELDFKDRVKFSGVGSGFDLDPNVELATPARGLDLGMKMPQSVMAGIYHRFNDQWAVLGSVGWDDWSRFGRVRVEVQGTEIRRVVDAGFKDTYHFGIGAEYQYNPMLMMTAGFSYDSSMMDSETRPINLPLGDMWRYGLGFKYQKSDDVTMGGGLSYMWEGDLKTKPAGNAGQGFVSGKYDNVSITFLSFYVQWR